MSELSTRVGALQLRNPLLLASGIWGESGASLARCLRSGAAGVVTKSIGSAAREGYPNPTVETLGEWGMLNAMGLPNPGIDTYPTEIAEALAAGGAVIGSIFGGDAEEFGTLARKMSATGVHAIELNLSCPHAKGYGSEIGQDPDRLAEVVRAAKRESSLPIWAKVTPNSHDPGGLAEAAVRAGADAITAINTVRGLAIDPTLRRPVLAHGTGGLSGPAIKPIGLACVWQIFDRVKVPIVGVGGITSGADALEYLLAGAHAVQIGTAVATRGIEVFAQVEKELDARLRDGGLASVAEAVGAAHRR